MDQNFKKYEPKNRKIWTKNLKNIEFSSPVYVRSW